jgi:hypothetical protein
LPLEGGLEGWKTLDLPPDTARWIRSIERAHEHGGPRHHRIEEEDVLAFGGVGTAVG